VARERAPEGPKALDRILGVRFRDGSLRELALTHRSYAFENELPANNERLEFLGDAVLGVVVTDMAFLEFPEMPEGELAKLRAAIVNMSALADAARDLGLGRFVLLGRGEEMSGGRDKSSILADALEAVLGAVYLDRDLPAARKLIERVFRPRMIAYVRGEGERDYKTILQELASAEVRSVPEYRIRERGPDHQKEFTATVFLAGKEWGTGIGRSKKEAEQQAAHQAYVRLSERAEPAEPAEPAGQWGAGGAQGASADARAVAPRKKGA
jgi:ribonuclease III